MGIDFLWRGNVPLIIQVDPPMSGIIWWNVRPIIIYGKYET